MSSEELKPCPFCGGHKVQAKHDDGIFWHKCADCGATGPTLSRYSGEEGEPYTEWNTRAQLAAIQGGMGEVVATIEQCEPYEDGTPNPCKTLRWAGNSAEDDFPAGTKFYTIPPASPDVEGLVKALEDCAGRLRLLIDSRRHKMLDVVAEEKARAALSTWRQAHTPSTLPASSAEE